jgi:hypothetical protein
VAVVASAARSGATERALSATVVITKARRGWPFRLCNCVAMTAPRAAAASVNTANIGTWISRSPMTSGTSAALATAPMTVVATAATTPAMAAVRRIERPADVGAVMMVEGEMVVGAVIAGSFSID